MKKVTLLILALSLLLLSACGPKEAAAPTGEPSASPVITPEPVTTPDPTVTPDPTATPEPSPTPEPDPTPDAYGEEARRGKMEELYHRPFEELPQELRDELEWDGEVRTFEGYNCRLRTYTAPGITLVTTEAPAETLDSFLAFQLSLPEEDREVPGDDDAVRAEIEGEKGREWLHSFTLTDDRYATVLGLKVGSTVEEAEALGYPIPDEQLAAGVAYFGVPMETHLTVTLQDGAVTAIEGSFGLGRFVGKYWDI